MSKEYTFECTYCGYKWDQIYWLEPDVEHMKCQKCEDKNLKITADEKINYYKQKST